MKRLINKTAIQKTNYDSTYVGALSYHIIQIKEEGNYIGHVICNNEVINQINVNTSEKHKNMQANVDFQKFGFNNNTQKQAKLKYEIKSGGYLMLFNSWGDTPYKFKLEKVGKKPDAKIICDTNKLKEGDLYACTLLRPGAYDVICNGKKTSKIYVEYPTEKTKKKKLSEGVRVPIYTKGIKNKEIYVLPMQGLVFELHTGCCIQVNLVKEEKFKGLVYGKSKSLKKIKQKKPLRKYKWRNPKYKQES